LKDLTILIALGINSSWLALRLVSSTISPWESKYANE
jgi:hypothetical protein